MSEHGHKRRVFRCHFSPSRTRMRALRGIGTHPMEVPLSETPTDPNPTDTVNAATETGEKMIPLSVVAPLLMWARARLERDHGRTLAASYDRVAQYAGLPTTTQEFSEQTAEFMADSEAMFNALSRAHRN